MAINKEGCEAKELRLRIRDGIRPLNPVRRRRSTADKPKTCWPIHQAREFAVGLADATGHLSGLPLADINTVTAHVAARDIETFRSLLSRVQIRIWLDGIFDSGNSLPPRTQDEYSLTDLSHDGSTARELILQSPLQRVFDQRCALPVNHSWPLSSKCQ
jgi:hypothetical protein